MTQQDVENGSWWGAIVEPTNPQWGCPECGVWNPAADWEATEVGCEDCGTHEGRVCPQCDYTFDHVWGAERIEVAEPRIRMLTRRGVRRDVHPAQVRAKLGEGWEVQVGQPSWEVLLRPICLRSHRSKNTCPRRHLD